MLTKNSHKNGVDVPYGNSVLLDSSENAPESRRLGKAFRLGAYSTPREKYVFVVGKWWLEDQKTDGLQLIRSSRELVIEKEEEGE